MKFMEKQILLKTDSLFNFVSSALNNLVFTPVRVLQEVSKKSVYLKRKQLDTLLFTAVMVGIGLTIATAFLKLVSQNFNILSGKFPLILMIVGDIVLVAIYAVFSSSKLVVYDTLSSSEVKKELGIVKCKTSEKSGSLCEEQMTKSEVSLSNKNKEPLKETSNGSCATPVSISDDDIQALQSWAEKHDYFKACPNDKILDSVEIKQYQNRLKEGIEKLEDFKQDTIKYSEAELEILQKKLDGVTPPGKYINEEYVKRLDLLQQMDEVDVSEMEIDEVPENFKLVL